MDMLADWRTKNQSLTMFVRLFFQRLPTGGGGIHGRDQRVGEERHREGLQEPERRDARQDCQGVHTYAYISAPPLECFAVKEVHAQNYVKHKHYKWDLYRAGTCVCPEIFPALFRVQNDLVFQCVRAENYTGPTAVLTGGWG